MPSARNRATEATGQSHDMVSSMPYHDAPCPELHVTTRLDILNPNPAPFIFIRQRQQQNRSQAGLSVFQQQFAAVQLGNRQYQ